MKNVRDAAILVAIVIAIAGGEIMLERSAVARGADWYQNSGRKAEMGGIVHRLGKAVEEGNTAAAMRCLDDRDNLVDTIKKELSASGHYASMKDPWWDFHPTETGSWLVAPNPEIRIYL